MAMSKTYYTVEGQVWGEHRSGESDSRDYLHDALGNVVAVFQNGWEIAEAFYKPHGEFAGQWNFVAHGYRFGWVGAHGYRRTNMAYITHYVRARHYSQIGANWTTVDPLWPREAAYGYVEGRVMSAVDYWGLAKTYPLSTTPTVESPIAYPGGPIQCNPLWNAYIYDYCNRCYEQNPGGGLWCSIRCDEMARTYFRKCKKNGPGPGKFRPPPFSSGPVSPWPVTGGSPPPTSGMRFENPYSPKNFKYGNCCGYDLACGCNEANPGGAAIDCLDRACANHDECLDTWPHALTGLASCNLKFCEDLMKCDCSQDYGNATNREKCELAKRNMMTLWCSIGAANAVSPIQWLRWAPRGGD